MPKITLEFENEKLAEEFVRWYYVKDGCDAFTDTLKSRNVIVTSDHCRVRWARPTRTFTHTMGSRIR
jgi:hypothetical protein